MTENPGFTTFGDVEIARVPEWQGNLFTRGDFLPESDRQDREAQRAWLRPDFWAPEPEDAWLLRKAPSSAVPAGRSCSTPASATTRPDAARRRSTGWTRPTWTTSTGVPLSRKATNLLSKADFTQLADLAKTGAPDPFGFATAFLDSIAAGPGHSPGACVLTLMSHGQNAT
ncbi:hypothetical protein SAMN05421837_106180 [Amycolatopsis pretoriensis]|uniref:Uncharacterized protein n=1 Tax=Amycolatopsis pretoriensis TaxID=218821 RepID=A0A1H5R2Q5_9PSEU|nr:hypothetical protein [Amycolatopsis pretoriensis]SEF32334.1 hypothetical protein SAMN05421837_106180 [Amycolatopsis pretoriensis]